MTAPTAPVAPPAAPTVAKEEPLTITVDGKRVPALLVEKNIDGSGGTLVPIVKASTSCTHCFGTGYIRHGSLIECPWCTEEGKKGPNAWMAG